MPLDLTALENAVARFDEGLKTLGEHPEDTLMRDGVIQRFEFTYELAHKMLKRYLETTSANPAQFDSMVFADLIRTGNEQGLLRSGWDAWRTYRHARSQTSHTYDEAKAVQVAAGLSGFLEEARHLLAQLKARTAPCG
ncbi:MAG: nucleotidyltransferase [Desulfovibrionales bacterium GWA2_65_9]|nr:MAG: nucleotidyltransferase [Desulfovibrionales bacterium GWA2_65_9]